jgi:hypothetical protein
VVARLLCMPKKAMFAEGLGFDPLLLHPFSFASHRHIMRGNIQVDILKVVESCRGGCEQGEGSVLNFNSH